MKKPRDWNIITWLGSLRWGSNLVSRHEVSDILFTSQKPTKRKQKQRWWILDLSPTIKNMSYQYNETMLTSFVLLKHLWEQDGWRHVCVVRDALETEAEESPEPRRLTPACISISTTNKKINKKNTEQIYGKWGALITNRDKADARDKEWCIIFL